MAFKGIVGVSSISMRSLSPKNQRPPRTSYGFVTSGSQLPAFSPIINRHTGKPHEHKREIARRLRQKGDA